jgi:hypothetical protein
VSSETGGDVAGIDVRWRVVHRRNAVVLSTQTLSIAAGYLP